MTQSDQPVNERQAAIEFSATPWAYTKFWLVNLLLTIATLGIYGAWAKVRNNQYLYGHTNVEGHRLQYLATPKQILIGRLIALGVLLVFVIISAVSPVFAGLLYLALIPLMPWLIMQGLKFTYRNTTYRNVRFDFKGSYLGSCFHFILLPIVAMFTFYLALPWVIKKIHQYMFGNCVYGGRELELNTQTGQYYKAALAVMGISVAAALFVIGTMAGLFTAMENPENASPFAFVPLILVIYFFMFLTQSVFNAMIRNHIVGNLKAEGVARFDSRITVGGYLGMTLLNAVLILFTLGLAYPATKVLKLRYLAANTTVYLTPQIDHMVNQVEGNDEAFGEEAAGLFDTDLSII
ncbi:MAG TPA: DUF898 domain-containing protein [Porticoccaceae bacterium]|nr:DUF898 domain-containing protein [Porticoccaceae bacterium]